MLERKADASLVEAVRVRRAVAGSSVSRSGSTWTCPPPRPPWSRRTRRSSGWAAGRSPRPSSRRARCAPSSGRRVARSTPRPRRRVDGAGRRRLGGTVAYVSTSAPLVFVDLPSDGVAALAERPEVLSLGLEQEWRTFMSSAGPTVGANWTSGGGDQGNGVRVAVVEYHNVSNTGDLAGQVVVATARRGRSRPTSIRPGSAGAIASRSSTWRGVAPGADIVQLEHRRLQARALDRPRRHRGGRLGDLTRAAEMPTSSTPASARTPPPAQRKRVDTSTPIGWEDGRLVVAASGNFGTFGHWNVVSPATGYNVLAVGGVNDRNTGGTGRRHPLVRIERRELPRSGRDRMELARRLQQAEPVSPGGQRSNGEWHDRRWDEHREPDRGRHRGPAHRALRRPSRPGRRQRARSSWPARTAGLPCRAAA